MDFLKQHYEKVVLGALLLGFVFAMIYLLQKINSAKEVTLRDLQFSAPATKYESANFASENFKPGHILGERGVWNNRRPDADAGSVADLATPFPGLRCSECHKIVPLAEVKSKLQCPLCGAKLETPPEVSDAQSEVGGIDSDGDGMPDAYEDRMGFNKNDAGDASQDADGDGFSNLYEYLMGTDPRDPKSFPGFEKRIYLQRIFKRKLPVKLLGVTVIEDPADKTSKKFWDISLRLNRRTTSVMIGDEVTVGKQKFKVADAIYRTRDKQDSGVVTDDDDSIVILEPVDGGEKWELQRGKDIFSPNYTAVIEDVANGSRYVVGPGDVFRVGDDKIGFAAFQMVSADPTKGKDGEVAILNQETGEVTRLGEISIPPHARVSAGGAGMGRSIPEAMENPEPAPARRRRRN